MKIEDKVGDTNTKAGDVYVYEGELVLIGFDGTSVPPFVHTVFNSMQLGLPVASRNESNNEKFPIISERQYMNENEYKLYLIRLNQFRLDQNRLSLIQIGYVD